MKKRISFFVFSMLFCLYTYSSCIIRCQARYMYEKYHPAEPPSYFDGPLGRVPLTNGQGAYYEKEWSILYDLNIEFYSGFEYNELIRTQRYNVNSIIGVVRWSNGGYSVIVEYGWYTKMKYVDEKEIKYKSDGSKIDKVTGYDQDNMLWEIYF